jgi:hypothetical protein
VKASLVLLAYCEVVFTFILDEKLNEGKFLAILLLKLSIGVYKGIIYTTYFK